MENKKIKKAVITGKKHYALNEAPEGFREPAGEEPEVEETALQAPDDSKMPTQKEFQFQAGSGLEEILKLLVKISQPPTPRNPKSMDDSGTTTESENSPEAEPELPGPEAIHPSSSGWVIWLAIIILAAFYFLVRK
jgi:hypothetical protein